MLKRTIATSLFLCLPIFADSQPTGITSQGEGVVKAKPDMATISAGVVSENVKAVAAMEENTAAVAKMLSTIERFGVEKKDVKTSSFQITPNFVYVNNQKPKLVGYSVTTELEIAVHKLDAAGKLLDALVRDGANRVNSVSFGISEMSSKLDEAREVAVKDAKKRAEMMARAAGVTLGSLINLSELDNAPPPRPRFFAAAETSFAKNAEVPLQAGEQGIKVTVTALWGVHGAK